MSKFLLIYPTMITEAPTNLALISAVLRDEGFDSDIIVNTFKRPLEVQDFVDFAKEKGSTIAFITMMTFDVLRVYEIAKALKRAGLEVVLGGCHPTDCPEEGIKNGADIVVRNEAEMTIKELCDYWRGNKQLHEILGITYKQGENIVSNDPRPRMDLDWLPQPDLTKFDIELFKGDDGIIKGFHRIFTSRGCPGVCTFCDWQVFKQTMRYHPISKIMEYIQMVADKYGMTSFSIADDCFTVDPQRVYEFCKQIVRIRPRITWRSNSRANLVSNRMLRAMKKAGCHFTAFGLESGDEETLKRVGKMVTVEENIQAPIMAHEVGMDVYGCLMTGFPWETPKHVQSQIDFIHKLWDAVSLFQVSGSLMPFPGTAIYRMYHKEYGFTNYWLKPEYQNFGIQVYQNALNPLKVSTFYQRYLFDDTYIQKEYFFRYTPEYKAKVREFVLEVGRHNLIYMFPNQPRKQKLILFLSKLSMKLYDIFPDLEMKVGGFFFDLFHKKDRRAGIEKRRDVRRGFVKKL